VGPAPHAPGAQHLCTASTLAATGAPPRAAPRSSPHPLPDVSGASGTLRAALAAAAASADNSSTIDFAPALAGANITLDPANGALGLDPAGGRSLSIVGANGAAAGSITVTTLGTARLSANVAVDFSLSISSLVLQGITFNLAPGALLSLAGVTMSGAGKDTGRAVTAPSGSRLTATGCEFSDHAISGTGVHGGAILASAAQVSLTSCRFLRNKANRAGAIYSDDGGSLSIASSLFVNISSETHGGAIRAFNVELSITDTVFEPAPAAAL
jgi:hypothetical protein